MENQIVPMVERIIAYKPWDELTDTERLNIFTLVDKALGKRRMLYQRYSRGIDFISTGQVHYDTYNPTNTDTDANSKLRILLEKFIIDIAAG